MGYRLNEGLLWATPLESSYGYARRLMVANPGLSLSNLRRALPNLPGTVNQCPVCADHLFHPSVYGLRCLTHCPLHHCKLQSSCPKCHNSWGRPFRSRTPVCDKCGVLPKADWGKTQIKCRDLRKLRWLTRWVARCEEQKSRCTYVSLWDIHGRVEARRGRQLPSFFEPDIENKYHMAFECQRAGGTNQDRLNRMHVVTHNRPLKSRTSELRSWPVLEEDSYLLRKNRDSQDSILRRTATEAEMITLITVALRRILRWQRDALGFEHRLVWSELRNMRPENLREGEPPCDLCMAFSFWFSLINAKFTNKWMDMDSEGAHELFRFANYRFQPNIPAGIFVEDRQSKAWRPSLHFERWLFLRASENAFAEYVSLANWLFAKTADKAVRYKATGYPGQVFQYGMYPSQILETQLEGSRLVARYWPDSPLIDIQFNQDARDRIRDCQGVDPSDWSFVGAVEADHHKCHQDQTRELLGCLMHPSRWLFGPWIECAHEGYLDRVSPLYDYEVLRSRNSFFSFLDDH